MSEVIKALWTVAGLLGAVIVIGVLALIFTGVIHAIIKTFKRGGKRDE
jgi:hypothetical protein